MTHVMSPFLFISLSVKEKGSDMTGSPEVKG